MHPVTIALLMFVVGLLALVLVMTIQSKKKAIVPSPLPASCDQASERLKRVEIHVDQKLDELREVHDQSLKGMKLDVRAALEAKGTSPLDKKVKELKNLTGPHGPV